MNIKFELKVEDEKLMPAMVYYILIMVLMKRQYLCQLEL